MAGSISVGGKVIATHTGPKGAGTVDLDVNSFKIGGTEVMNKNNLHSGGIEETYTENGITYRVHTFYNSGDFICVSDLNVDVFMLGGGGGGGCGYYSGGGGAGGAIYRKNMSLTAQSYSLVIGSGGAGSLNTALRGSMGSNTTGFGMTAVGGGGGGSRAGERNGGDGGCAGGTSYPNNIGGITLQLTSDGISAESNTYGIGNGTPNNATSDYGTGGAGLGSSPLLSSAYIWGLYGSHGGYGIQEGSTITVNSQSMTFSINGKKQWFGAGGNGGSADKLLPRVNGIGGTGSAHDSPGIWSSPGIDSTGSGGGGGGGTESTTQTSYLTSIYPGKEGGSGIIIIRYVL